MWVYPYPLLAEKLISIIAWYCYWSIIFLSVMNWGKDGSIFSEIVSISIIVSPYLRLCCLPLRFISHCLWEARKSNESFKSVKNSYNAVVIRRYPSSLQNWRQIPQKKTVCHISNVLDVLDKFQYCSHVDGDNLLSLTTRCLPCKSQSLKIKMRFAVPIDV